MTSLLSRGNDYKEVAMVVLSFHITIIMYHCTMGLSIALRIWKIKKSRGPDFTQFQSKPSEAVWDSWKTDQRFRENISVKYLSKMRYLWTKNMKGVAVKVEILHRDQSDPALEKTSKQLFWQLSPSWCKYLPNIFIH